MIIRAALAVAGMMLAGSLAARPMVIEPVATLPAPPGGYDSYGAQVAIDGDYALTTAFRLDPVSGSELVAGLLYRRTASGWVYDSTLYETEFNPGDVSYLPTVAMRGGVAALNFGGIFRRIASGWVRESASGGRGPDLESSSGRFAFGTGEVDWGANVAERDATGTWGFSRIQGPMRDGDNDNNGGPLDIDDNTLALAAPDVSEGETGGAHLYRFRAGTGWGFLARPPFIAGLAPGPNLALRGNELFIDAISQRAYDGTYLYRDESGGDDWNPDWQFRGRLQTADSYMGQGFNSALEKSPNYVFQHRFSHDLGAEVWHVFRANADGRHEHVATLANRDRASLGHHIDVSGRRVIVASHGFFTGVNADRNVRIFHLPADGTVAGSVLMDQFATNSNSSYDQTPGGTFARANNGISVVFRQQFLDGDAQAIHVDSERRDGAIQVDVRPRAFDGGDRWFGLVSRFADAQNYYYVTVRNSGSIQLKRMAGGVFTTLTSAPLSVTLRNYRLRLESVGIWHRVFVDDRLVLQARDGNLRQGRLGLMTSHTSADFDNLVITPNGLSTIYSSAFTQGEAPGPWVNTGPGAWAQGSSGVYQQNSVAGDARAVIGAASAEDQILSVRVRATAFAAPSGTQERWFGAMLRYLDDRNYVFVSLRNSNRVSLRQVVDGRVSVLREAALTVTPGTWYSLRAEALPDATRVYVNGNLRLQAPPVQPLPRGQVGLVTFKAAAEYDNLLAYQP
jgi:hypothetical protein